MKENKNMAMLKGKTVVLGVTGGIAAYKSAALTGNHDRTRQTVYCSADVRVAYREKMFDGYV